MLDHIIHAPNMIEFIKAVGLLGVVTIVFVESGFFFGFFLPGDSLLFASGVLAALGVFSLPTLLILIPLAAILGDNVGYFFGKKVGSTLYTKKESRFFKQEHLRKAEHFYERHGPKALVIARFVPIVRTFVPIVAGMARMKYKTFLTYNIVGGIVWSTLLLTLGYFLGTTVKNIDKYLMPIVFGIIFISLLPLIREYLSSRNKR